VVAGYEPWRRNLPLIVAALIERRPDWDAWRRDRQGCDADDWAEGVEDATLLCVTDEPIMAKLGLLRDACARGNLLIGGNTDA
jgi:hypothetical protein